MVLHNGSETGSKRMLWRRTRMGLTIKKIAVLRMAEILAPGSGSQFYDYLQDPICLCRLV